MPKKQWINREWYRSVLDRASESLGEAGTIRQHNEHPFPWVDAEFSQCGGNSGRFFGRFEMGH
jgi:hypothetical protein